MPRVASSKQRVRTSSRAIAVVGTASDVVHGRFGERPANPMELLYSSGAASSGAVCATDSMLLSAPQDSFLSLEDAGELNPSIADLASDADLSDRHGDLGESHLFLSLPRDPLSTVRSFEDLLPAFTADACTQGYGAYGAHNPLALYTQHRMEQKPVPPPYEAVASSGTLSSVLTPRCHSAAGPRTPHKSRLNSHARGMDPSVATILEEAKEALLFMAQVKRNMLQ
ncbi:hypothetical protein BC830DRAFT_1130798 [Chytriomyces sp. MP71]|nr:hypothetical protein BC830DRAFT_1130798 [Chytriomyces sp. MP71]